MKRPAVVMIAGLSF